MDNSITYTPLQAQALEMFPDYNRFMKVMYPANLASVYADVTSIKKSVAEKRLTIGELFAIYPAAESRTVEYMKDWLEYFQNLLNITRRLPLVDNVAVMLCTYYSDLYFSDLKLITELILTGRFGTFYGSVDAQRIAYSFNEYYQARMKIINDSINGNEVKLSASEESLLLEEVTKKHRTALKQEIHQQLVDEGVDVSERPVLVELRYNERFTVLFEAEKKKKIEEKVKQRNNK